MAFFDDLGKQLSQTGQTVAQKSKEMAAVVKIKNSISEEERKINNTYNEIGKLYVTRHENEVEEDFAEMIQSIRESEKKIQELRQEIRQIKGVVHCDNCGADVPKESAFCSKCGAKL